MQRIVDRVTMLRDGHYIDTCDFAGTTMPKIISMMVGGDIKEKFPRVDCERGGKVLEVKNLNAGDMVKDISLELYEGEIVGVAGLMGAGRTEMTRALFGVECKQSGEILLCGEPQRRNGRGLRQKRGDSAAHQRRKPALRDGAEPVRNGLRRNEVGGAGFERRHART